MLVKMPVGRVKDKHCECKRETTSVAPPAYSSFPVAIWSVSWKDSPATELQDPVAELVK